MHHPDPQRSPVTVTLALLGLLIAGAAAPRASAQTPDPEWWVGKPSNTGIPGEEVRLTRWAPDGLLWVGARWPFWGEGGFGLYDLAAEAWTVYADWESPLPSPFVNDLEFEADGTAWIATSGGLVRYDDGVWTTWNASNSPLAFDTVVNLSLAPDGHVWVNNSSSQQGGDAVYDFDGVSTWVRHAVPTELPFAAPWTDLENVFVTSDGHVWVANTTLQGVAEWDGATWTLRGGNVNRFDDMAEDQFGNLWLKNNLVGGLDAVHRWDGTSFATYPFPEPTVLRSGPDGTIWVGNWFGQVFRTSNGGASFQTWISGLNRVTDIAPRPGGGEIWVGTPGAVGRFTAGAAWIEDFNTWNTGLPDYFVDDFRSDDDGYFWLTTGEAGLSRFDGLRWRNWGDHNVGAEPYPFAGNEPMAGLFQDRDGVHWFGGNGIARWHSDSGQFDGFWNWQNNPGMGVTMFPFFAQDAEGRIFAATRYGTVFRFDPSSQLWVNDNQIYATLGLPGMQSDARGDVWLVGWFDIERWDGTAWTTVTLPHPDYFFDLGGINDFDIGPDGTFWFGTVEGLVRWDGVDFTLFDTASSPLHAPLVTGVDVRSDGLLAVAARGSGSSSPSGIALVDGDPALPGNWTTHLMGDAPIPHWQIGHCAFDPQGDLWLSATSEGTAVLRLGAWTDHGGASVGGAGMPHVVGSGLPVADQIVRLHLEHAPPASTALLALGVTELGAPLYGGTLVPEPLIVLGLPADAGGRVDAAGAWPPGVPPGFRFYAQFWMADAAASGGWSSSNGISAETE